MDVRVPQAWNEKLARTFHHANAGRQLYIKRLHCLNLSARDDNDSICFDCAVLWIDDSHISDRERLADSRPDAVEPQQANRKKPHKGAHLQSGLSKRSGGSLTR